MNSISETDSQDEPSFIGLNYRKVSNSVGNSEEADLLDHYQSVAQNSEGSSREAVKKKGVVKKPKTQVLGSKTEQKACCDEKCYLF